ncbi:asparagine synthase C-terminal domain-containing protein [Luteimonas fraxinea]|uniref:asparagine synthase (glutamine-hydrolyzing) n=1 Tax=Luteimonas fraxinea TaxID=2901869 RepID=A0ABS8U6E9_9GAMM|nr:asparagine synthase C-terminal domain-containing protein [Luteimonas fraxinea]MCD9095363.1 asparagine synthase C-terminal domain-containing protein [Luteimonas fraxinea]UHH11423.1 asparagine synthase C-terminal domain-containing protein [Luteimonas fraxinea]
MSNSTFQVLAAEGTPVLALPHRTALIGHAFDDVGKPIVHIEQCPMVSDANALRDFIVRRWWGEYVFLHAGPNGELSVTRSPSASSGMACVYGFDGSRSFVTSDIGIAVALKLYDRRIDWDYLASYLTFPFLRTQRTALHGVAELLPGECAGIQRSDVTIEQVWSPWAMVSPEKRFTDIKEAECAVRAAVLMSTRALAGIDGAVHLELSGGLDSSIVAAGLRETSASVACSTLLSPDPGSDERVYAGAVADALPAELRTHEIAFDALAFSFVDPADPVRPGVGPLQQALDQAMESAAAATAANAAFVGAGGDSVFCYLRTAAPAADAFKELGVVGGVRALNDLAHLHECTLWRASRLALRKLRVAPLPYRPDTTFLSCGGAAAQALEHPWFDAPPGALPGDQERIYELAGNQIFMDYAPRRMHRFLRMPLLSQPVMEACLRTPSWMWIRGGNNRAVARGAFQDLLPAKVFNRRSKGTLIGFLGEAYQRNKLQMEAFLLDGHLASKGLIDADALRAFNRTQMPSRDRSFTRVLDLCRVENWIRQQDSSR